MSSTSVIKSKENRVVSSSVQTEADAMAFQTGSANQKAASLQAKGSTNSTHRLQQQEKQHDVKRENNIKTLKDDPRKDTGKWQPGNGDSSSEGKNEKYTDQQVLILADSTFNGIQDDRLGHSYSFDCRKKKCYTTDKLIDTLEEEVKDDYKPDIIVIHCGINDIKNKSPQESSSNFMNATKSIREKIPKTKIVVSAIAPVKNKELNTKREAFNALNKSELLKFKDISYISHENLDPLSWKFMSKDGIHPTKQGHSLLARNLGRHVHHMIWNKVRTRRPHSNHKALDHNNHGRHLVDKHSHRWSTNDISLGNRFGSFDNDYW